MPKIHLKPNSPEFAESPDNFSERSCEMPGCPEKAEHKAPKHRGLNEYHYFCMEHVREYNKAWNFFDGMSNDEVQDHILKAMYGDRPTWKYSTEGSAEEALRRKAWQTQNNTTEEPPEQHYKNEYTNKGTINTNTPEYEAMAIMGIEPPLDLAQIRKKYKELAKKHHPDLNNNCKKSEEVLKKINMAYTILKMAYAKFEKLPEHKK